MPSVKWLVAVSCCLLLCPSVRVAGACCTDACEDPVCTVEADTGIVATIEPEPLIRVCPQAANPPGVVTAEQWWNYLSGGGNIRWLAVEDYDRWIYETWTPIDSDPYDQDEPCYCQYDRVEHRWLDNRFIYTWSGSVDLTQVGYHALICWITQPLTDPNDECPPLNESKTVYFCVIVEEPPGEDCNCPCRPGDDECCCNCPDCPGDASDWVDVTDSVTSNNCDPGETWDDPITLYTDDCGNTFTVTCTNGQYQTSPGGGTCFWDWGANTWKYSEKTYVCGKKSLHATFHRTTDTEDSLPSYKDRGTCGQYDWSDTFYYSCPVGPPAPPACCGGTEDPGRDENATCGTGNCVNKCDGGPCPCPLPP